MFEIFNLRKSKAPIQIIATTDANKPMKISNIKPGRIETTTTTTHPSLAYDVANLQHLLEDESDRITTLETAVKILIENKND